MAGIEEERRGRVDPGTLDEPDAQGIGRSRPEGAGALLAALAVEGDQRNGVESDVADVEGDHANQPRTGRAARKINPGPGRPRRRGRRSTVLP
jgi:hypothetical protein